MITAAVRRQRRCIRVRRPWAVKRRAAAEGPEGAETKLEPFRQLEADLLLSLLSALRALRLRVEWIHTFAGAQADLDQR